MKNTFLFWCKKHIFPFKVIIKINNNCNLWCKFCNIWQEKKQSIIENELLSTFASRYGKHLRILSFTGGEIFLVADIEKKIRICLDNSPHLRVFSCTTNGFFTKKIVSILENILKDYKSIVWIINISIDGDEKTHNTLRWNTISYQKASETLQKLSLLQKKYWNLKVQKEFLLSTYNKDSLKDFIWEKESIISIVQNSYFYQNTNTEIQKKKILEYSDIKSSKGFIKKRFLRGYFHKVYNCYALKSSFFINWDGNIYPCINWNQWIWNLREIHEFYKRLENNNFSKLKQQIWEKKCPNCWTPCDGYLSVLHEFWK